MKKIKIILSLALIGFAAKWNAVAQNADTNSAAWISRPLSLADCLNVALQQNATILKAQNDLEASHGLVVQTRAVALPQLTASGQYKYTDPNGIENFPNAPTFAKPKLERGNPDRPIHLRRRKNGGRVPRRRRDEAAGARAISDRRRRHAAQ
jgi:hypothetical protein